MRKTHQVAIKKYEIGDVTLARKLLDSRDLLADEFLRMSIIMYYCHGIRRTTTIPQSWDRAKVLCMSGWFMGGYSAVRNSC
jgi:hypothetical protein